MKLVNAYGQITKNGMKIDTESSFGRALIKKGSKFMWTTNNPNKIGKNIYEFRVLTYNEMMEIKNKRVLEITDKIESIQI